MRRFTSVGMLAALVGTTVAGQNPEFDVASIKRNTTNQFASGPPPNSSTGLFSLVNAPVRNLVLRAFPLQTIPLQVFGLPSWAESERYDVIAKGRAGTTPEEQQQMWRALLADRMKLAAHYETREQPSWDLVFSRSDRRLGPQIRPSTLDCSQSAGPPPRPQPGTDLKQMAMNRCSNFFFLVICLTQVTAISCGRAVVDDAAAGGEYL